MIIQIWCCSLLRLAVTSFLKPRSEVNSTSGKQDKSASRTIALISKDNVKLAYVGEMSSSMLYNSGLYILETKETSTLRLVLQHASQLWNVFLVTKETSWQFVALTRIQHPWLLNVRCANPARCDSVKDQFGCLGHRNATTWEWWF